MAYLKGNKNAIPIRLKLFVQVCIILAVEYHFRVPRLFGELRANRAIDILKLRFQKRLHMSIQRSPKLVILLQLLFKLLYSCFL